MYNVYKILGAVRIGIIYENGNHKNNLLETIRPFRRFFHPPHNVSYRETNRHVNFYPTFGPLIKSASVINIKRKLLIQPLRKTTPNTF